MTLKPQLSRWLGGGMTPLGPNVGGCGPVEPASSLKASRFALRAAAAAKGVALLGAERLELRAALVKAGVTSHAVVVVAPSIDALTW
jgi:hypothetical protein